ncbi:hypothetical protein OG927_26255 [Streptomyces clavifer]|uniref:hypothetical protein n=1 Tax=Streptomyces clavifer TaxID=68188 RepID=UPI002E81F2CA|nr:hypothetical protein [Streptomyces clavifer]WUC30633.1 hypothetical protein OG927_26255 [Streptomyces clavifer]
MPVGSRRAAQGRAPALGAGSPGTRAHHVAREAAGGRWLVLGKDGRLSAYALGDGGMLRWTQERPGGTAWAGPELVPVPGLNSLSVAQGPDGFVHFVGRRAVHKDEGPPVVDLMSATQFQTGRPVTQWRTLGNPHSERPKAALLGVPAAAVSGQGTVHVFVRNADGDLLLRCEKTGGKWEAWHDSKVRRAQDGTATVTTVSGRVEVLAPGTDVTLRLSRHEPDGAYQRDQDIPHAHAPGSAVALETARDRITYYWADGSHGGVTAHRPGTPPIPLGGAPCTGPVAALRTALDGYDCTVLAHGTPDGRVMLTACGTENEADGVWWSPTGDHCTGGPALACDAAGRVVLALIGTDGALRIARQNGEPGLALGPSAQV